MKFRSLLQAWLLAPTVLLVTCVLGIWSGLIPPRSIGALLVAGLITLSGFVSAIVFSIAMICLKKNSSLRNGYNYAVATAAAFPALHLICWIMVGMVNAIRYENG